MRPYARVRAVALAVLLVGALLLSGCATIQSTFVVNKDASGELRLLLTASRAISALAGDAAPLEGVSARLQDVPGGEIRPYFDLVSGQRGVELVVPFRGLDDLVTSELGGSGSPISMKWNQAGNVNDLEFGVDLAGLATSAQSSPVSAQDRGLGAVAAAVSGLRVTYAFALPGQILDWAPKDGATYNVERNEITWTSHFTDGPEKFKVSWDNSLSPMPIDAPTIPSGTLSRGVALDALQKYTTAAVSRDRAAVTALLAPGGIYVNPLAERFPTVFTSGAFRVAYLFSQATESGGVAEWVGKWQVQGRSYDLSGVDVLTLDPTGRILSAQVYVDPAQMLDLAKALP